MSRFRMSRMSLRHRGANPPLLLVFRLLLHLLLLLVAQPSKGAAAEPPCLQNPCRNGGKCEPFSGTPDGYQCICPEPYGGPNCTIENPTCIDMPCLNGASCEDLPNRQFKCICPPGFAGLRCEFKDPCLVKPCLNGARCFSNNLGKRECHCPAGFTGDDCSVDVNECAIGERSPCEHSGTCINEPGGYRCECLSGYTGPRCETLVLNCKPNPCLHGGLCHDKGDGHECLCPRGYEGKRCETNSNDCAGSPCKNGGICEDLIGDFRCNCLPGWKGHFCEEKMLPCDSKPCLNNGVCENTATGHRCHCTQGFKGSRCEVDVDDCVGISCLNGGYCVDQPNAWYCQCPPGYSGRNCEVQETPASASGLATCRKGKSCLHSGTCHRSSGDRQAEAFCDCPLNWHGEFCEIPVCPEDACANGGRCEALLLHFGNEFEPSQKQSYCSCPPGFFGDYCLDRVDRCAADLCTNGGSCLDEAGGGARCRCLPGFGGNRCERTLRTCSEEPCLNGASCVEATAPTETSTKSLFSCRCAPGFEGKFCESRIPCFGMSCGNHGHCKRGTNGQPDECLCEAGWGGSECQLRVTSELQPVSLTCTSEPCANLAQCVPSKGARGFRCLCETALGNFTGELCDQDVDECASDPCRNGGKCLNTRGSFVCKCPPGFDGALCERPVDPCDSTYGPICSNGGVCIAVNGRPTCRCPPGFSGSRCEIEDDECSRKPCLNGGLCMPFLGSYACRCPTEFSGRHCERSLAFSPCRNQTCQNGGYCKPVSFIEECECPPGFYGRYCEVKLNLCHQLLEIDLVSSSYNGEGRLLGNRRTLSLTSATTALIESKRNDGVELDTDLLTSMHLSKTTLGPCYPQGTLQCIPKPGDFSCQCRYGFDGRFCEQRRDFCAEAELREGRSVCLNGGQCLNHRKGIDDQPSPVKAEESFICQCPAGFSGPRCEIRTPSCDNVSLCQNGGVCTVEGTRLKCDCPHGLGGTFCEVDLVDECARAGNCLNGGRCIDGHGNYTCECLPDFCGRRCELSGFACAIEATTDPNRWPGEAAEARLCEIAECQMKAGNGRCDPECDRFACGFDAGECLYSMQFLTDPVSVHDAKLTMALPWANCTAIHQEGFPCHLRFGDGKCDPTCDSASCLFDGWDCMHDSIDANLPSRTFARTKGKVEWEERSKSPPEPVEGSLILLLGVPPSELLPEDNKKRGLERQFLEGLGRLLRVQLRIRQLPNTGAPMVYPVKIMTQTTTPRAQPRKDNFWSLLDPTVAAGGMNVSVNQLIIDQGQTHNLEQVIALLTTGAHKPEILHRRRREAQEVKLGSRVFLEVQDGSCQKSGSCIHNVETAAQFVSAALRTRRYTPPVDILSIETASPETLQQLMSDGSYSGGRRSIFDHLGLHGTLVYCLIGLICSLVLLSLFGVLYGIMQRRVQGQDIEPGSGYGQKNLMKKIKTTSIWYPRNSGSREGSRHQHHHHSAVFGGFPTAACAEGGTGTPSLATQARARAMVTPHSSHLPFWSRERALAAAGEKLALRASAYPAPQPLPPTPSTTAGYSQACTTANADSSQVPNAEISSTTPLLTALPVMASSQLSQVDVKAYFTSLMENLVTGDGLTESFSDGLVQKLEYLRNIEMQHSESTIYRGGGGGGGGSGGAGSGTSQRHAKRQPTNTLLAQLLASTVPETGETLLHLAARHNCASAVSALLNAGADPYAFDSQGNSVLLTAVNASAVDAVRTLLMSNQVASDLPRLFVACPTEDKTTALIQAVKIADIEMVELLLQTMASLLPEPAPLQMGPPGTGLSPYALMQNRRPPLDPRLGYPRMYSTTATTVTAPMLVNPAEEGAGGLSTNSFGVNAADGEGRTALHWAAVTEQPAMVHLLLRAGASHDVQTAHEETPLTLAAREGSVDVCSILLAAGANIEIADYLDRTPRQLAAQNGHTEVVQLLQVFSTAPPPNPGQHHFARRTYTQPFFPQQQQTMPSCYYRGVPVTTTVGSVYSEGQTYEKRTKYEPPDFPNVGSGESFLMQLAPTTSSASGANTTTTESSKTFFFDQPPQYPGLNSMTKSSGVYGGAENCWALRNQPAATNNGHTPSSDTESPAHWSSPSPTAISPPVPPPKMTVATSGHYQVAPSSATHTTLPCCPSHQVTENYAAAAPASGGFTVSYAAAVDDCIKLEPRVF